MDIAHSSQYDKALQAAKNLPMPPWIPSGADLSPPDIYANPQLKPRLKEKGLSTRGGLMADVSRELGDMRRESSLLNGIRKCFRIVGNRAKWAHAHGGVCVCVGGGAASAW